MDPEDKPTHRGSQGQAPVESGDLPIEVELYRQLDCKHYLECVDKVSREHGSGQHAWQSWGCYGCEHASTKIYPTPPRIKQRSRSPLGEMSALECPWCDNAKGKFAETCPDCSIRVSDKRRAELKETIMRMKGDNISQKAIAEAIGMSEEWVSWTVRGMV